MTDTIEKNPNRREILLAGTVLGATTVLTVDAATSMAQAQQRVRPAPSGPPNIV